MLLFGMWVFDIAHSLEKNYKKITLYSKALLSYPQFTNYIHLIKLILQQPKGEVLCKV